MESALSDRLQQSGFAANARARSVPVAMKIVVAGGFAVGKTTFVGAISEIDPLRTEAEMTVEGLGVDNAGAVAGKTGTTVAMDFGRITIDDELVMYMFGTPGQARFWFMWDDLVRGAVGAVVVVDCRRLADSFEAVDYFETNKRIPYIVALNKFDGRLDYTLDQIREALEIGLEVPIIDFDARDRLSGGEVLKTLLRYALEYNRTGEPVG
jgi:signal recognition particle receptor subunit beta